ncbi:curlin [Oricola cellulosilytica]|uniref:Curlin n=1 Tax=Oricola cellulosilytica TaxID=1429082 RepID=A0A4R0PAI8_9HYPH|nr:curlin [Oricola cellulosilytica]TCD14260.1 curlin [Oricola cellulosilytica]
MTPKSFKGAAAGLIATTALIAPASAGGSFSVEIVPTSRESASAIRTGLDLYSYYNKSRRGAVVRQYGSDNSAGIAQRGSRNYGVVHQEGTGHSGTLRQYGSDNAYGLFQFGRNTRSDVAQSGNRQSGLTFQWGW